MRIVSMVPSATEILCALGLAKDMVGISHDCDYPAEILNLPRLTGTTLGSDLTSYEIDQRVRTSANSLIDLVASQVRTERRAGQPWEIQDFSGIVTIVGDSDHVLRQAQGAQDFGRTRHHRNDSHG